MTKRLALTENLAFLQRVAQNGQLSEYYSGVRDELRNSLQAATWLPIDDRMEQCLEILQQDKGYRSGYSGEKMRAETEREIAEVEVREQLTSSPERTDFVSGTREAEDILQIWLQREKDWSSLPENILRERAFVLLSEEDFGRALPLIEQHLPPERVARAIGEVAGNALPYRFESAIDMMEQAPALPGNHGNNELNFAHRALHAMDDRISPLLLAENLQARAPSLTVDHLAATWAAWLQKEGGDAAVVSQLEGLIHSPKVRNLYQKGKLNFP
ncbi:hypothetical protein AAFN60_07435 [Roseibacillus persicicus]|uniref:hypothetical protein n=1 Tax=Roseibacillus persicicus TaxID=454148 RepID=UPI00398B84E7